MPRTLDLVALRAVVTVAECGSVTRAADLLHLTQSAVSMQIRRLEEALGMELFNRSQRRMELSLSGQKLTDYARRMLRLNDEALCSLGALEGREEIRIGLPHDLVSPQIPEVLRVMGVGWPQLHVALTIDYTRSLLNRFGAGELDMILTTQTHPGPEGEVLGERKLVWLGLTGTVVRPDRPVRVALGKTCIFRSIALEALERAGILAENALDGDSEAVIEASVAAGMALTARLEGTHIHGCEALGAQNGLPDLGSASICYYRKPALRSAAADALEVELRRAYGS